MQPSSITTTGASRALPVQLAFAQQSPEERSRAIRKAVSLAMEGPLGLSPLPPMPVPTGQFRSRPRPSTPVLSPLPASQAADRARSENP
jgi:hypothetical protein